MLTTRKKYGYVRDLPDFRDQHIALPFSFAAESLPAKVDLSPWCPPVYDQGQLGSCTANAIGGLIETMYAKESKPLFVPSRLFIYYFERLVEGTVGIDSGAQIRDGMKVCANVGAPPESLWPYDIGRFAVQPPPPVTHAALAHKISQYSRLDGDPSQRLANAKHCLAVLKCPFVFGFTVYESFESQQVAQTGLVPMPGPGEQVLGGHAVLCVGYDMATRRFLVRNSWGSGWGQNGYCFFPFSYLTNAGLSSDFWCARMAT